MTFRHPQLSSRPWLPLKIIAALFFCSGATSLIFETVFTRLLSLTFGNTAQAVSTVLAAFLGGLALGAFLLGRWVDRRSPSLWIYGVLELLVGGYCLLIPLLFGGLTHTYVALYHRLHLSPAGLTGVQLALAGLMILVPAVLMGGTLPVLARFVASRRREFEPEVSRLYGWNTLGAALGTLASTYLLMPVLGVRGTIALVSGVNFAIFLCVAGLATRAQGLPAQEASAPADESSPARPASRRDQVWWWTLASFLTGAVALSYEVIWTHVLAFLIGNTVYAFGVMLFTFLCGLGAGAHLVARRLPRPESWAAALAASQLLLALVIFATTPLWTRIPDVFAQGLTRAFEFDLLSVAFLLLLRMLFVGWRIYRRPIGGRFPWLCGVELAAEGGLLLLIMTADTGPLWKYEATYFVSGELLRFFCAFYLLILPSLLLGVSFPLLLNLASHGARRVGGSVGGIYAANTAGAIAGSLLAGFVFLPRWGSLATLRGAGTANLLLAVGIAAWLVPLERGRKIALTAGAVFLAVVVWAVQGEWDPRRMARGTYVYFTAGWPIERVLYHREDTQGGLTSVIQIGSTRVLLSNGKFQGNNSGERGAQIRFALIPLLFTQEFERALVIGLGTGNTLRTVAKFPFQQLDAVEIAPHIVEAARLWFEDVNGHVFDRDPRVRLTIADGRNFLLLSRERYDLITIEVSSIWISGEANLYNREFYELCRARLKDRGILQQWVQIHHMRTEDFLVILNTAAHVFPHVAFFLGPEQGLLVASSLPLECDYRQIEKFGADPGVREELATIGAPSMTALLGEMMLYGGALEKALSFLPQLRGRSRAWVSTDFEPYLEYQTPKGNALPYNTVPLNINFVRRFRAELPLPEALIRNVPSLDETNLIRGYVAAHQGDSHAAIEYLRQVKGPARARAQAEIARLEAAASGKR